LATTLEQPTRLVVDRLKVVIAGGDIDVVDDISFSLPAGKTLGLVGESGSGKSTVALALLGYARSGLEIRAGRVLLDDVDILRTSREERRAIRGSRIAYVPQDPSTSLNPALRVGTQLSEVIDKPAPTNRLVDGGARPTIVEALREVRLPGDVVDAYPHQLSGGQQQRVALAMAFLLRPSVIVLDEPTTGLDVTTQRHILDTVVDMCASHGVAGVFVSHDLSVVSELADEVAVLYAGRLIEVGGKAQVLGDPAHPYTRGLVGAAPSPERSHRLQGLDGYPPAPGARPLGCFFASRCRFRQERCEASQPLAVPVDGISEHRARCMRIAELPPFTIPRAERVGHVGKSGDGEILSITDVSATYGDSQVLTDLSWDLSANSCLAIVGESGSGKTTMARCVVGLHHAWSGGVSLHGHTLPRRATDRAKEDLRAVQYVFQNPYASLNPRRTVADIVEQPLRFLFALSRREREHRVAHALDRAALTNGFLKRRPSELSGGERQRVAIARALVAQPEVLVCDEVTSALDVSVQAAIIETLRRLQEEDGLSLLFITHNIALVRSIAQRVIVMQSGRVVEEGTTSDILDSPTMEYTQQLLADTPKPSAILRTGAAAVSSVRVGDRASGPMINQESKAR
jgi:peptide/nickel transport system ATP-binding protein